MPLHYGDPNAWSGDHGELPKHLRTDDTEFHKAANRPDPPKRLKVMSLTKEETYTTNAPPTHDPKQVFSQGGIQAQYGASENLSKR